MLAHDEAITYEQALHSAQAVLGKLNTGGKDPVLRVSSINILFLHFFPSILLSSLSSSSSSSPSSSPSSSFPSSPSSSSTTLLFCYSYYRYGNATFLQR